MQAIKTTYKGPTNTRGSRFIASCDAKRITVGYDHALNVTENHTAAARELAESLGWLETCDLVSGGLPCGSYAHVLVCRAGT